LPDAKAESQKIVFVGSSSASFAIVQQSLGRFGSIEQAFGFGDGASFEQLLPGTNLIVIELGAQSEGWFEALSLCSTVRATQWRVPIIIIATAGLEVESRHGIELLMSGADEIFSWPVDRAGFAARARSLIRRANWSGDNSVRS
jgi:DNA-binding response OmpR family regulator